MDQNTVRGTMNQLLYPIDSAPNLADDAVVARLAEGIFGQRFFTSSTQEFSTAIQSVLREGRLPAQTASLSTRYSEDELLDFLRRLNNYLEERRPWPEPPFVKLDIAEWGSFASAKAIAQINRPMLEVEGILGSFDSVAAGEQRLPATILKLRSGDVVAVIGSVDARSTTYALLQRDPGDATEVIRRFCELTGFAAKDVIPPPAAS
jgi:hypothetical protein